MEAGAFPVNRHTSRSFAIIEVRAELNSEEMFTLASHAGCTAAYPRSVHTRRSATRPLMMAHTPSLPSTTGSPLPLAATYPYDYWLELTPQLAEAAHAQLNEPPTQDKCIALAEDLLQQATAAGISTERGWFSYSPQGYCVMYLRWAKWDVAKAFQRLQAMDLWHATAMKDEDVLALRSNDFNKLFDLGLMRAIGRQGRSGATLQLMRPGALRNSKLEEPRVLLRFNAWFMRRSLHDKNLHVHGLALLGTFQGMSFIDAIRFMRQTKPVMQAQLRFLSECAPFRTQAIVLMHQPKFFSILYAFISPFLSAKMKSRMRLLGNNTKKLHAEYADASVLPADFGGSHPDNGEAYFAQLAVQEAREDEANVHETASEQASTT